MRFSPLAISHPVARWATHATLASACTLAHAQAVAPSQVTPPSMRPEATPAAPRELQLPPAAAPSVDAAEAALDVQVQRVQVDGGRDDMAEAARTTVQALQGQRVTLRDIRLAAAQLEDAYRRDGYFLVRVTLPPQRLTDGGTLRITVIDGFIEQVDAAAVPERLREAVLDTVAPLLGKRGLRLQEAERRIRLAGSLAGLRLRSALAAGEQAGSSKLLLEGDLRSAGASLTVDNGLARSLGTTEALLTVSLNSPLGRGERFYAALGTGHRVGGWASGEAPLALAGVGLVAPMGIEGWSLNPEFTQTILNPEPGANALRTRGELSRGALRLSAPLLYTQASAASVQFALEHVSQQQKSPEFGLTLSSDRYTALRVGVDGTHALAFTGTSLLASAQWSQGLGGREPATASDPGLSRQGAAPHFKRLNAQLRATQPLADRLDLALIATGQASFGDPLLTSEQFVLSGPEAVSGHSSGSLAVDEGAVLRGELSWSLPTASPAGGLKLATASPYLFAAAGHGRLLRPTAVEQAQIHPRSAGIGLRTAALTADGGQAQLALELARCWTVLDDDGRRWRLSVRLGVSM